jgi:hypothetical protein
MNQRLVLPLIAVLACLAAPVGAQNADFTETELQSFAVAAAAINEIATRWQPQVRASTDADTTRQLMEQVDNEMRQAVENTEGIDIDTYQGIMQAAQTDPVLKARIDGMIANLSD